MHGRMELLLCRGFISLFFVVVLNRMFPTCLFQNVENLLRCPICFDFLNITMMTKCSHNCKLSLNDLWGPQITVVMSIFGEGEQLI